MRLFSAVFIVCDYVTRRDTNSSRTGSQMSLSPLQNVFGFLLHLICLVVQIEIVVLEKQEQ